MTRFELLRAIFKEIRAHQMETFGSSVTTFNGKEFLSGGGAECGFHAVAAHSTAKARLHALDRADKERAGK